MVAMSGQDPNRSNFLIAFAIGKSESSELLNALISFAIEEGGLNVLNTDRTTFLSDRGKAITQSIKSSAPNANHHFCPRHLAENVENHFGKHAVPYFWAARNAMTSAAHTKAMDSLRDRFKGKQKKLSKTLHDYLSSIDNWQLHSFVIADIKLYNLKSSNCIESVSLVSTLTILLK